MYENYENWIYLVRYTWPPSSAVQPSAVQHNLALHKLLLSVAGALHKRQSVVGKASGAGIVLELGPVAGTALLLPVAGTVLELPKVSAVWRAAEKSAVHRAGTGASSPEPRSVMK